MTLCLLIQVEGGTPNPQLKLSINNEHDDSTGGMIVKDSRWTWRIVSLVAGLTTLLLVFGFGYAVNDIVNPAAEATGPAAQDEARPQQPVQDGTLRVVALGDSLAKGTGDNTGSGFVRRALTGLQEQGAEVELLGNLAVNGLTTAGLLETLDDTGVQYALKQANVVILSIGGNDLFRGTGILSGAAGAGQPAEAERTGEAAPAAGGQAAPGAGQEPAGGEIDPEELLQALPEASGRLKTILQQIAKLNPDAQVYYIGLYNPFGDVPDLLIPGNQAVTAWNNAALDIINQHPRMALVPTLDLFRSQYDRYLSSDHFHPSGEGYQRIADRITQAVILP